MLFKEKQVYHQIHPLKLSVDILTGFFTSYLAWQHQIAWFLILSVLPSVLISLWLIRYWDLEWLKNSPLGRYIKVYMTSYIEAIRIFGQILMWIAAWFHLPLLIVLGFLLIIVAWCNGIWFKK